MDFGISRYLEEIAFGLASFATMSSALMYSRYKSTARNLETAPALNVGPELATSMKALANIPYAVITGRVFPLDPSRTLDTISGMPAVISKLHTKESRWTDALSLNMRLSDILTIGKMDLNDNQITPALQYVPFALFNPNTTTTNPSGSAVMVDDVPSGEFENLLLTAKATYVPTEITFTGLIASFLRGFHSVGVVTKESVLPVGTVITVVGEVTKLSGEKSGFRIGKSSAGGLTTPYILTTKNIMEVKSSFRTQAAAFKVLSMLCGCFAIMTFYALGKKWLPRFRLRRVQQFIQRQRNSSSNVEGLHQAQICVTCLQNPREVALFPCGHVCVCADCSLRLQEKCPVCRENVVETMAVYLA